VPRSTTRTGDPVTLLQLLWAPGTKVGRSGTTLEAMTQAAIDLADARGLEALTMRAVADRIGVGAMTLYGYVPGKPELLELMLDQVAGTTYQGHPLPGSLPGWREGLRHIVDRNYAHALDHGWSTAVPPARPIVGPGNSLKYEAELAPLDGIGLTDHLMDHALTTVLGMTNAAARWHLGLERVRADTQLTDDQWWALSQPIVSPALNELDLPISTRVGQTVASAGDPHATLHAGLELILNGLAHDIR